MYDFEFKCPHCDSMAFEYKEMPKNGDMLTAKLAYLPKKDKKPNNCEKVICDNCEKEISAGYLVPSRVFKKAA